METNFEPSNVLEGSPKLFRIDPPFFFNPTSHTDLPGFGDLHKHPWSRFWSGLPCPASWSTESPLPEIRSSFSRPGSLPNLPARRESLFPVNRFLLKSPQTEQSGRRTGESRCGSGIRSLRSRKTGWWWLLPRWISEAGGRGTRRLLSENLKGQYSKCSTILSNIPEFSNGNPERRSLMHGPYSGHIYEIVIVQCKYPKKNMFHEEVFFDFRNIRAFSGI